LCPHAAKTGKEMQVLTQLSVWGCIGGDFECGILDCALKEINA
jgi:hypothetical protein